MFQGQAPDLAETLAVGAAGAGLTRVVSSRIEFPLDRRQGLQRVWGGLARYAPFLAAVVLAVIGFLCLTGPLAPYLASLPGSLASRANSTPTAAPPIVAGALPAATTGSPSELPPDPGSYRYNRIDPH